MQNFLKNIDIQKIKHQVSDLKDQVEAIHLRKPWTREGKTSPVMLLAVGAGLAVAGYALYRKREQVAKFCASCGKDMKAGIKDKAERAMLKVKAQASEMAMASNNSNNSDGSIAD